MWFFVPTLAFIMSNAMELTMLGSTLQGLSSIPDEALTGQTERHTQRVAQ